MVWEVMEDSDNPQSEATAATKEFGKPTKRNGAKPTFFNLYKRIVKSLNPGGEQKDKNQGRIVEEEESYTPPVDEEIHVLKNKKAEDGSVIHFRYVKTGLEKSPNPQPAAKETGTPHEIGQPTNSSDGAKPSFFEKIVNFLNPGGEQKDDNKGHMVEEEANYTPQVDEEINVLLEEKNDDERSVIRFLDVKNGSIIHFRYGSDGGPKKDEEEACASSTPLADDEIQKKDTEVDTIDSSVKSQKKEGRIIKEEECGGSVLKNASGGSVLDTCASLVGSEKDKEQGRDGSVVHCQDASICSSKRSWRKNNDKTNGSIVKEGTSDGSVVHGQDVSVCSSKRSWRNKMNGPIAKEETKDGPVVHGQDASVCSSERSWRAKKDETNGHILKEETSDGSVVHGQDASVCSSKRSWRKNKDKANGPIVKEETSDGSVVDFRDTEGDSSTKSQTKKTEKKETEKAGRIVKEAPSDGSVTFFQDTGDASNKSQKKETKKEKEEGRIAREEASDGSVTYFRDTGDSSTRSQKKRTKSEKNKEERIVKEAPSDGSVTYILDTSDSSTRGQKKNTKKEKKAGRVVKDEASDSSVTYIRDAGVSSTRSQKKEEYGSTTLVDGDETKEQKRIEEARDDEPIPAAADSDATHRAFAINNPVAQHAPPVVAALPKRIGVPHDAYSPVVPAQAGPIEKRKTIRKERDAARREVQHLKNVIHAMSTAITDAE